MSIVLLFIYLGGTTLPLVNCFSDGNFDGNQDVCQSMAVDHDGLPYQDPASNPFTVDPDYVDVTVSGEVVTVSLRANSGRFFRGFMLEARETNDGPPVGVFSVLDSSISRLQRCNGVVGSAVTQTNNQDKTEVQVSWTTPNTGRYFFRAAFVENLETFWARKDISPPTTTTTTTTSTSSTPFTTTSASALTTVTSVPISTLQPDPTTVTDVTSLVPTSTTDPATSVRASAQGISSTDTTVASTHALPSASTQLSDPTTITEVISLVPTSTTDPTTSSGASTQGFSSTDTTVTSTQSPHSASIQLSDPTTITEVTSLVPTSTTDTTTSTGASTQGFSSTDTTVTSTQSPHSASTQLSDPTTITEVTSLVPTFTTDSTTSTGASTQGFSSTDTTVTSTQSPHSASTQLSGPTTITEVTSLVPTSTTDPITSTGTTSAKSDLSVYKTGSDWFLILLLASYLSLVEGFPFLMKHRKRRNVVVMQVSSVLSLLFSLVAFIILLILTELVAAKVLTGLAVFLSLCQMIVIFSFREPNHELRRPLCWVFGLVAFANICVTAAAIFVGLVQCKVCLWLLIVMAAYLASDLLFNMLCLIFTYKARGQIIQRISFRSVCLVISTLVNIAFTVALVIGIFLCNYGTVTTGQSSGNT